MKADNEAVIDKLAVLLSKKALALAGGTVEDTTIMVLTGPPRGQVYNTVDVKDIMNIFELPLRTSDMAAFSGKVAAVLEHHYKSAEQLDTEFDE